MKKIGLLALCLFILSFVTFHFYQKPMEVFEHQEIIDLIHQKGIHSIFKQADIHKYNQDYPKAILDFEKTLTLDLQLAERQYALNQLAFISLTMNKDSVAHHWIEQLENEKYPLSISDSADYFYNVGTWAYHTFKPKMAETYLQKALVAYKSLYGEQHLKVGLCLTQLGLLELDFEQRLEVVRNYTTRAYDIFQSNQTLKIFSAHCELAMGLSSYLQRGHDLALAHCENAFYLSFNSKLWRDTILISRALSYRGQMIKKKAEKATDNLIQKRLLDSAEILFLKAIKNFSNYNSVRIQELYRNLMVLYCFKKDSVKFYENNTILQNYVNGQGDFYGYNERLLGYFSYYTGNNVKSLRHYYTFIKEHSKDTLCAGSLKEEAFVIVIRNFLIKDDYDSALNYCLQYGGYKNLEHFLTTTYQSNANVEYNKFFIYQFIGESILSRYKKLKVVDDLKKFISISVTADSLLFNRKLLENEDVQIRYQKDVGVGLYDKSLEALHSLYSINHDSKLLDLAFKFSERMKSSVLFRDINLISTDDSLRKTKAEVDRLRGEHENSKEYQYETSQCYCFSSRTLEKKLQKKVDKAYQIPSIDDIRKVIQPQQCVIQYFVHENAFGLLISKDTVLFRKINSDSLNVYLSSYRSCLIALEPSKIQENKTLFKTSSGYLYNTLIKPFESAINNVRDVLIVPDKMLHNIPFESFTTHNQWNSYKNAPYFIKTNHVISYAPSWKIYNKNRENTEGLKSFKTLCYSYGNGASDLACSESEVNSISEKLGSKNVTKFSKDGCSKRSFLSEWQKDYNIVHLSLHAKGSLVDLFDNKILFNVDKKEYLYGYELSGYTTNKDLIVLSACETGLGNASASEGAYSLARCFFQVGAKNVIATLWKVDDCQNAKIVKYFYDNLPKCKKTKLALSQAKCQFLFEDKDDFLYHPSFWAGMICLD